MKATRIHGMKKGITFCHFPRNVNIMEQIKIQIYRNKKITTYYGTQFKQNGDHWIFQIGDLTCKIFKHKNKFRVNDEDNVLFDNSQVAGVFYVEELMANSPSENVDDEHHRIQTLKCPPYRLFDSHILSIMQTPTFISDRTGQCTRNREYMSALLNESYALKLYEIHARNNIIASHYNSMRNRFGENKFQIYVCSDHFVSHLFKAIDHYFFANTLKLMATWVFYFDKHPSIQLSPGKTCIFVKVNKDQFKCKSVKSIVSNYENGLTAILYSLLSSSKEELKIEDVQTIGKHLFNGYAETDLFTYTMRDVPTIEYQMLYNGDKPGLILLS